MSDQKRTYEAEVRQVKASKLTPDPKPEELFGQQVNLPKRRTQRTFSRETVVRLIDWLKQE